MPESQSDPLIQRLDRLERELVLEASNSIPPHRYSVCNPYGAEGKAIPNRGRYNGGRELCTYRQQWKHTRRTR